MVAETYAVRMIAPPFYTKTDCSRVRERLYILCLRFYGAVLSSFTKRRDISHNAITVSFHIRGLLEKYPTFGREKETGLLGALDT